MNTIWALIIFTSVPGRSISVTSVDGFSNAVSCQEAGVKISGIKRIDRGFDTYTYDTWTECIEKK